MIYKTTPANQPATRNSVWQDIKPFAKFGLKAIGIMATAAWSIIKLIPKPSEFKDRR